MSRLDWLTVLLIGWVAGYVVRGLVSGCGVWSSIGGC